MGNCVLIKKKRLDINLVVFINLNFNNQLLLGNNPFLIIEKYLNYLTFNHDNVYFTLITFDNEAFTKYKEHKMLKTFKLKYSNFTHTNNFNFFSYFNTNIDKILLSLNKLNPNTFVSILAFCVNIDISNDQYELFKKKINDILKMCFKCSFKIFITNLQQTKLLDFVEEDTIVLHEFSNTNLEINLINYLVPRIYKPIN